jgi:type IV secretion system protein TrbG
MPTVQASPQHATEIVFGQDERVASITLGDPMRWDVKVTGNRVLIKPCPQGCSNTNNTGAAAGMPVPQAPKVFSTNLIVDTSARSYHVWLHCGGRPMESFNFWFPDEIAAAQQARSEALRKSVEQAAASPAQLNRNYAISGPAVPWRPDAAFDDGSREWLHFPDKAALESDMPTLYALQGKTETLVNWTPAAGNYYVVDRLYQAAVLTVGSGKDRPEVRITARAN